VEADWEFEVGGGAPVIEAQWPGFVDLQCAPECSRLLPEARQMPALAKALEDLNASSSPVWTSKCDFWPCLDADEFDPGELDAEPGCCGCAIGCYIDLLPRSDQQWRLPEQIASACKDLCSLLCAVPLRCCRADLVIRRAFLTAERMDLGMTVYLTSCGESPEKAAQKLQDALMAFTGALSASRQ
jgi:hypothetical protein